MERYGLMVVIPTLTALLLSSLNNLQFFFVFLYALQGYSPVLHCASLLRIILRVISARALKNGGLFFTAGPRQRDKSLFARKRAW